MARMVFDDDPNSPIVECDCGMDVYFTNNDIGTSEQCSCGRTYTLDNGRTGFSMTEAQE